MILSDIIDVRLCPDARGSQPPRLQEQHLGPIAYSACCLAVYSPASSFHLATGGGDSAEALFLPGVWCCLGCGEEGE